MPSLVIFSFFFLQQFVIECRKSKTKVITLANQEASSAVDQLDLQANTCNWRQARENASEQVTIGFAFCFSLVEKVARVLPANHRAW